MKGKVSKNKFLKVVLPALLVVAIICQAVGFQAVLAKGNVATTSLMTYPNVQQYTKEAGQDFTLAENSRIFVVANEKTLNNTILLKDLKLTSSNFEAAGVLSKAPIIVFGKEENAVVNDIVVRMEDVAELEGKAESYKLDITDKITVTAKDEIGIYYGLMSVIQMLKINDKILEKGTVIDYPDVELRSMHLDIARKPFSKEWIIRQIKDLSWQKYNAVQLHFSENEGFRIQSDTLDAIEGFKYKYDDVLSKQDILDIIQVANDYHIEIVPSLDSPGHSGAVLQYLPTDYSCRELFPTDDRRNQCFNIFTNPEAREFLVNLMTEFIEFFGDAGCKHFNIGGDEFLAKFSSFSNEQYGQIMTYFNDISKIVKDNGMTPRAWNDGLLFGDYEGYTLDSDIEVCYWAAPENCASVADFVANGNKVINYSDVYMYYVLSRWWQTNAVPEGDRIYNEWHPGKFSNLSGTAQTFEEPYPEYVMGGSYAVWCDDPNYESEQRVEDKIYHRTRATAYKMWNENDNQPDYDVFKAAVDKLGRTPGFNEALPAPGEVFQGEDTATVTIKYIDNFGKTIAADDVFYGLNDSEYHFEAKELFGYSFIESDLPLDGKYNGNMTITLKYQLHCDKTDLKKEIFEPLAVSEYINETVADYNKALTMAKEIYFDETSGQLAVNNALRALQDAKNKAVKLEYYSLYVEVTYPLNESDYSSGYQAYKNAVTTGKTLLNSEGLTAEKAKEAYNAIQTAKQSLVKPNAKVPTISATDTYYQSNNYNNMIDGNINTKCWFNSNQEIGKEVKFTFTRPINISSIQIIQPSNAGEDIIDGADVQISTDGKNWTTVGTLDNSAFEKTITFDKTLTKYVRIVLTEGKGNWYQIAEVKFELEEIPEDSTLKDMILEAETLNIIGKSSGSVNEMIDALIVAQKSYVEGKVDVTEETNNLHNAINALRDTVTSNKEKLTNKINDAKEIENNNYSIESWSRFEKALLEAIIVNEDSNATQEQVDKAYDDLDKAIKGLIDAPVIVDKKELSNVIETTNDFVEKDYTVDSWKAFKEALDHAKDVLQNENTTQDEVDQALASLQDAIKNLKTVSQTGNNDQPNQKPNDQIQTSIKKEDDNKTSSTKNNSHIKTGDDMSVVPYILLMATAGGYIALQRRNKED